MEESTGSIQCIGKLEITQPTKTAGFICGSLPVPTDFSLFHSSTPAAVLVPSPSPPPHTIGAPQYQMLPNETDLNTLPPVLSDDSASEKLFPTFDAKSSNEEPHWGPVHQNLSRKCEALAVTGLTEYGDELDVVAPTDILKQIFKIPYSKAQLSITVHRVGDTLILNSGPGHEDGEKKIRRKSNQSKTSDPSILLNFAMHSVRAEACDCPPTHNPSSEKTTSSTILPGTKSFVSSTDSQSNKSKLLEKNTDKYHWGNNRAKKKNKKGMVKSSSQVGEKANCPVQESDKFRRVGNDDFLRILFWQFHNFRMLLGSDMLIFSNEKYVAVSLHLWDVAKQVTPLTWLEAWLDNVMASVPEMAICYHDNGVVQGYELLKTDDIFLLKGISDDGVPAFHPQIVKQNGLSVLRFLQDNCKQDPGVYWLYKSAGEDVIQLYDLSVIPNNHATDNHDKSHSFLPSLMHKGRKESIFSLGTLLYRVAHRLSLSKAFNNSTKSAKFFRKCLDFLRDQDHLVVRAYAHEQFARLILKCYEELDLTSETFLIESEVTVTDLDDESSEFSLEMFGSTVRNVTSAQIVEGAPTHNGSLVQNSDPASSSCSNNNSVMMVETDSKDVSSLTSDTRDSLGMYYPTIVKHVTDPISSNLAAIHHVSQAIKSLRWKRQIQNTQEHLGDHGNIIQDEHPKFSVCACGDTNCIEVCDIREWLPKSKLDQKMWNLILLLGESYLALGDAYKEDGQLNKALKVVELACLVYGSMPQHLENTHFVSSMVDTASSGPQVKNGICLEDYSKAYLFWAKAWSLVGDVYVEWHYKRVKEISVQVEGSTQGNGIRMSNEVVREVTRLKKKLGQYKQNCSSCSLMNCSCQSDRASSGNSASGSSSSSTNTRKQSKKSNKKNSSHSPVRKIVDNDKPNSEDKKSHTTQTTSVATTVNHQDINKLDSDNLVKEPDSNSNGKNASGLRNGGIFKFLGNLKYSDTETNLSDAICCYDAARKAIGAYPKESPELHSIIKKMGWVFNELGRFRLECKNLAKAEFAFADAIKAFKEVSDYTNIILINCNLGHGRRALAEELVAKMDEFKQHEFFQLARRQTMKAAKLEYFESLKFYGAAKMELTSAVNLPNYLELYNEVLTQFANTHLRLGMLLAKEATSTEDIDITSSDEISASDSFREALVAYESLGDLRKQEAAFTHYHLACHHRDICLKYLDFERKHVELSTYETSRQKAKRYANLADRHWQKSIDFYRPKTHSDMFLNVIMEQSALSWSLASTLNSNTKMGAALLRLLEGRHVAESNESVRLWNQLQTLLKSMLATSLSNPNRAAESRKLKEMYRMSLKSTSLEQLHQVYELWVS